MLEQFAIKVKPSPSTRALYRHFGILDEVSARLSHIGSVELMDPDPELAEVTFWEIVSVYLVGKVVEPFLSQAVQNLAGSFANWVSDRYSRGKGPTSKVAVKIYGPNGEILRTLVLDKEGKLHSEQ